VMGMLVGAGSAILLVLISPNMTYPLKMVADAKVVLEGAPAKPALEARKSEGVICEFFTFCKKSETAKPSIEALDSLPIEVLVLSNELDHDSTPEETITNDNQIKTLEKKIAKAQDDMAKFSGKTTSMMGLEKPLFRLKNPGIISIPLGFLMVILFSLLTRDKRSEDLWDELYVRQNTGLHVEDVSH
jgi:cation/acetate symporter